MAETTYPIKTEQLITNYNAAHATSTTHMRLLRLEQEIAELRVEQEWIGIDIARIQRSIDLLRQEQRSQRKAKHKRRT